MMTKFDMGKLEVAIKYTERMAEGRNPVKNVSVEDDSILNNPNVIRCMYFIKDILKAVRENEGVVGISSSKQYRSSFPFECLKGFRYEEDKSVSYFMRQIRKLAEDPNVKGISPKTVTDWLKSKGYLEDEIDRFTGEKHTVVTPTGREFGLYMENRVSSVGKTYQIVMYSRSAQEYLVNNLEAIAGRDAAKDPETIAGRDAAKGAETIAGRDAAKDPEAIAGRDAAKYPETIAGRDAAEYSERDEKAGTADNV